MRIEHNIKSDLLKEAKDCADFEAEYFIKSLEETANKYHFDIEWFITESIYRAHKKFNKKFKKNGS